MLMIMGVTLIFFGLWISAIEAWQDRGWPVGTAKGIDRMTCGIEKWNKI
jgi:hypothetical protein